MTADSSVPQSPPDSSQDSQDLQDSTEANRTLQVRFKSEAGRLLLLLPPEQESGESTAEGDWAKLWQQLKQRLDGGEQFWQPNTAVYLLARDRLLDGRQLQMIVDVLAASQLRFKRLYTNRRQTAVAAVTAGYSVEQQQFPVAQLKQSQVQTESGQALAEPLYLYTTVRSGVEIRHPGTIVIVGDINPGGTAIADGDILVWGRLRGLAHAGASGNKRCRIMALHLEPTQLRIANAVARAPENPPEPFCPEVAYVTKEGIRIARAADFARHHFPQLK